ncbi:MAG: PhoH family protein [Candidatus Kapaibacterium sp.]|nr:MAG: PhoH family protein [Candidatus Kapabacteria bacterium]
MDSTEKKVRLETSDTLSLFGYNDSNLRILESHFAASITVRGNTVVLKGDMAEVRVIEKVLNELQYIIRRTGTLSTNDVLTVIDLVNPQKTGIKEFSLSTQTLTAHSDESNFDAPASHALPLSTPLVDAKSGEPVIYLAQGETIKARTPTQKIYFEKVRTNDIVFAIGPAGTGKTYLAVAMALALLRNREVSRLILSRPAVDAGESLGFLPGDYMEKVDPYLRPLLDALSDMVTPDKLKSMMEKRIVEIIPLAYMRGRTFNNSAIILDEAQNATGTQMKMFLTRMGKNSKLIVTGDVTQIDLPRRTESGLIQIQDVLKGIQGIEFVYFDKGDVVRHRLVAEIIDAYEKYSARQENLREASHYAPRGESRKHDLSEKNISEKSSSDKPITEKAPFDEPLQAN